MFLRCRFRCCSPNLRRTTNEAPALESRMEDWRKQRAPALEKVSCNQESKTTCLSCQLWTGSKAKERYRPRLLLQRPPGFSSLSVGRIPNKTNRKFCDYHTSHNHTRGPVWLMPVCRWTEQRTCQTGCLWLQNTPSLYSALSTLL